MACLGSHNDVGDQEVLPTNHIGGNGNAIVTVQLSAFEGEQHLGGPQPSPQTMEAIIVTGGDHPVQEPAAVAGDQNLDQFTGDNTAVADVEAQLGAVDLPLVPNQSDPIGQLRVIAASTLFSAGTVGALFLPGDLHGVHTTYGRAKLIASVGAPVTVAVFSLFSSFWLAYDPNKWNNWIRGLSALNVSMLAGPLAVYWTLTRGTEN